MPKKIVIMKKLNHYFQKVSFKSIVIILVATMSLTIPRIGTHSVVGNYQKSSMAITANNNFQLYKYDKEKPVAPSIFPALVGSLVFMSIFASLAIASGVGIGVFYAYGGQHLIYPDHINYSKYDFSRFDN